jgi:uncharacterized protein YuzB (UPF0349 family)
LLYFTTPIEHSIVKPGYSCIVNALAENSNLDIKLNQSVVEVHYSPSRCTVIAIDDKNNRVEHCSDIIVCSASLGVLKSGLISLFTTLPEWKQEAINKLGFDLLNKLVMEFDHAFWPELDMFGSLREKIECRGKFYQFWSLFGSTGKPILIALCTGASAHSFEREKSQDSIDEAMAILRRMYGENIPQPLTARCTAWSADQYARGSYSYIANGSSGADCDLLAASLENCLYFCGEACNRYYPATVHGAIISGLRTAGIIQNHYKHQITLPQLQIDSMESLDEFNERQAKLRQDALLYRQSLEQLLHSDEENKEITNQWLQQFKLRQKQRRGIRAQPPAAAPTLAHNRDEDQDQNDSAINPQAIKSKLAQARAALLSGNNNNPFINSAFNSSEVSVQPLVILPVKLSENPFAARASLPLNDFSPLLSFNDFAQQHNKHKNNKDKRKTEEKRDENSAAQHIIQQAIKRNKPISPNTQHNQPKEATESNTMAMDVTGDEHIPAHAKAEGFLYKYIKHAAATRYKCLNSSVEVKGSNLDSFPQEIKSIAKRTLEKVFSDYSASNVPMEQWLNEKRKDKIKSLIDKYFIKFHIES